MLGFNRGQKRARILKDPYYRLQSLEEVAIAAELGIILDVNRASIDDWLRLPGLSIHQARTLVELTTMGVQFLCLEDIAAALSVPVARLRPLEPILGFYFYDHDSVESPQRCNPNLAPLQDLSQLPLVDGALAERIVQERLRGGNYRNLADFQRRLGLKGDQVAQLMHYLQWI
ncbi:ComEA family DNA-binding protein [Spirulina subsalsa FACHB-351]|uniref:ComEA family DNA-binding protein n=1 Tax=Spirulina subsalsa FACHB-351 TaxID=234711 RepID=A0ABT3L4E5_9CYAN|nr:ComEA family DNA-binding protein [Spirulina subsalsa FACHB-351]